MADETMNTTWTRFWDLAEKAYERIVAAPDPSTAYEFLRSLEAYLAKYPSEKIEHAEEAKKLEDMIIICKWFALPMVRQEEVEDLFAKYFARVWELLPDYALWESMRGFLLTIVRFEERDEFKKKIKEIMEQNQMIATSAPFFVGGKRPASGTLGNWLADYRTWAGAGEPEPLVLTEYLTNGANMRRLDARDRDRLRQVFELYKHLNRSSLTPEGIEEDIPFEIPTGSGVARAGDFIKYEETALRDPMFWSTVKMFGGAPEEPAGAVVSGTGSAATRARAAYAGNDKEQAAAKKAEEEWAARFAGKKKEDVFIALFDAFSAPPGKSPASAAVLGAFRAAARSNALLLDFLRAERRIPPFLGEALGKDAKEQVKSFMLVPTSPASLRLFLRAVFEKRLGVSESDAARFGLHIANALKAAGHKDYMTMAYWDASEERFKWGS